MPREHFYYLGKGKPLVEQPSYDVGYTVHRVVLDDGVAHRVRANVTYEHGRCQAQTTRGERCTRQVAPGRRKYCNTHA